MKMPKKFFLVFIFCFCFFGCDDIRKENYPSGKIRLQAQYVNDQKNGPQIEFYESGAKKSEKNFVNGKEEGEAKEFYESGSVKAEISYEHGAIQGKMTQCYESGKIKSIAVYERGTIADFPQTFDPSGDPEIQGVYNDPRDGQRYEWVRIGDAVWLAENGKYAPVNGSLCVQCNVWGRLYNLESAKIACPTGFRLPKISDWKNLASAVGKEPAKKLKATFGWNDNGDGADEFSFAVRAGGANFARVGSANKKFKDAGEKAFFWTEEGSVAVFKKNSSDIHFEKFNSEFGASIRCIQK